MTSTDRLVAGVIGALLVPPTTFPRRLYEMNAALGVVIVCVAFATTMEVMMATTVAMRMTPGRENFWIRILIAFIYRKSTRFNCIHVERLYAFCCSKKYTIMISKKSIAVRCEKLARRRA